MTSSDTQRRGTIVWEEVTQWMESLGALLTPLDIFHLAIVIACECRRQGGKPPDVGALSETERQLYVYGWITHQDPQG